MTLRLKLLRVTNSARCAITKYSDHDCIRFAKARFNPRRLMIHDFSQRRLGSVSKGWMNRNGV